MIIPGNKTASASLTTISNLFLSSFIILLLYFGREILVPLALSALLTFMLAPLVTKLQRWLGRITAVLLVVMMMFSAAGVVGWAMTRQAIDLANALPSYKENIRIKIHAFQSSGQGSFSKISETFEDLKNDLPVHGRNSRPDASGAKPAIERTVMPVEIIDRKDERFEILQVVLAPVLGPLGTAALVLVLLIFMLLEREELRNRLIRLIGQGRMTTTARAMDDAGARVSRYLLMQIVVNVTYGIPVAIGLYFIGVPNAILWGALATVLRFIPYVGPWIAAAFPIVISIASSPGWMAPLLTIGLFVVLEVISNNVMEPWLYGASTGVTPIALIVAALVWTWLWGPVGLVLATPLTVCLVVMGRHIPKLAFISILLSVDEALTPAQDCYQRLLRVGEHDEMELVDYYLKSQPLVALFDSVLIPVVTAVESDHRLGFLEGEQFNFVHEGVSDILDAIATDSRAAHEAAFSVFCVPARAHRDQLAGEMFVQVLRQKGHTAQCAAAKMPLGELVAWVREAKANLVCISVVEPTTLIHARYLCAKLRAHSADLRIMVGLWGRTGLTPEMREIMLASGADEIVTSLTEAIGQVSILANPLAEETNDPALDTRGIGGIPLGAGDLG